MSKVPLQAKTSLPRDDEACLPPPPPPFSGNGLQMTASDETHDVGGYMGPAARREPEHLPCGVHLTVTVCLPESICSAFRVHKQPRLMANPLTNQPTK